MKRCFFIFILITIVVPAHGLLAAGSLAERLAGRIVLQVESYGRAWYIDPVSNQRYYLQNGNDAYKIMREKGLGITNADLAHIPERTGEYADHRLVNRLKGRILLQVEAHGEAWYVNPVDGIRYYLRDSETAYTLMRTMGLGISDTDLRTISINSTQIVHDTTFDNVAYVAYDGNQFSRPYYADQVLPLASLTKLMTALVFLDTQPDWQRSITITPEHIAYPSLMVGGDATSEVDFATGDRMRVYDVWVAMLVSSSNQAAVALADASGYSRDTFVQKMNEKARELGLVKTTFYDVTGLDAHNVTTAKEMAKLAYTAFSVAEINAASRQKNYSIAALDSSLQTKNINVIDRNYSLQQFSAEASKTGFLDEAQRTVALLKNGSVVVVLHARSMNERNTIIKSISK